MTPRQWGGYFVGCRGRTPSNGLTKRTWISPILFKSRSRYGQRTPRLERRASSRHAPASHSQGLRVGSPGGVAGPTGRNPAGAPRLARRPADAFPRGRSGGHARRDRGVRASTPSDRARAGMPGDLAGGPVVPLFGVEPGPAGRRAARAAPPPDGERAGGQPPV